MEHESQYWGTFRIGDDGEQKREVSLREVAEAQRADARALTQKLRQDVSRRRRSTPFLATGVNMEGRHVGGDDLEDLDG